MTSPDWPWADLRQLRHGLQPYRRRTTTLGRELRVHHAMERPGTSRRPREVGSVWAVGLVRNESDVIEASITHLLAQGVDHVLVADNLSSDGTDVILRQLAERHPHVHVVSDREPAFHQASKATGLAQLARRSGADWILPFDADEFWFAEQGTAADFLRGCDANTVRAHVFNALPVEADMPVRPDSLLRVEERPQRLQKVAVRSHRWLRLERGNHEVRRVGPVEKGLVVLHLPYRGLAQLRRKHAPDALVDRLASAAAEQAVQYRRVDDLEARGFDDLWSCLDAGVPVPRLNWAPAPMSAPVRALEWTSWLPRSPHDPTTASPAAHQD